MREVSVFYSFNDLEFYDRDECLEYEREALEKMKTFYQCCKLYNKDETVIWAPSSDDIEDWMDWFNEAANHCLYAKRIEMLPRDVEIFLNEEFGYCVLNDDFNNELGFFKYDDWKQEWVKVNE